jgi:hypothetical protein
VLILLAVWRGAGTAQESRPSWLFIVVLLAASAALVFTGYRGGKNVYEYGLGVKKIAVRPVEIPHGEQIHELAIYCAGMAPVKYAIT